MKKITIILLYIAAVILNANAQVLKTTKKESKKGLYVAAQGGYIFNNKQFKDAEWYLKNGKFADLQLGYRYNNLGFNVSGGYLNITRTANNAVKDVVIKQTSVYEANKVGLPSFKNGFDDKIFKMDAPNQTGFVQRDLNSIYVLAGPQYWLSKGKFDFNVNAQAGVGFTQSGYYIVDGVYSNLVDNKPSYITDGSSLQYNMNIVGKFSQSSMSAKYRALSGGNIVSNMPKEKRELYFMGRVGATIDYNLTKKWSLFGGANYWYKQTNMKRVFNTRGEAIYFENTSSGPSYTRGYSYTETSNKDALQFLSAQLGVRYKMYKVKQLETQVKTKEKAAAIQASNKNLMVTVKDELTGLALSGVKVDIYKDNQLLNSLFTDENGAIEAVQNLEPGNYVIVGEKNNIKTTVANIDVNDFKNNSMLVSKTLLHNDPRFTLIGYTVDKKSDSKVGGINTSLTNNSDGTNISQKSDKLGKFIYQLNQNTDYSVVANNKGYFSNIENVTTKGLNRSQTLYVKLELGVEELKEGNEIELQDIYYDLNKATIRPDAAKSLDNLVLMLNQNPEIKIELSAHTDSRGSDEANLELSQRRAENAVKYLVEKGISKDRLLAVGYGEKKLRNKCANGVPCSEKEHQKNRRTEIKIINKIIIK